MNQIWDYFEKISNLNDHDWQFFSWKLIRWKFPKKALLLIAGQTEATSYFLKEELSVFFIPRKANDLTFGFAFDNSFISAYDSFLA